MSEIEAIAAFMKAHKLTLTTAESCTAGLIAARLGDIPGAGSLLDSAYVVYSPDAKRRCLGVDPDTIERHGLTSEAVSSEMARGALAQSETNLAIANTGIAEPVDDKTPAGTQCYAWAFRLGADEIKVFTETRRFAGDRNAVRNAAADYALARIPDYFAQLDAPPVTPDSA